MSIELIPEDIRLKYRVFEWRNAASILYCDYNAEFNQIMNVLRNFELKKSHVIAKGGRKSPIAESLDSQFYDMDWEEKRLDIETTIDGARVEIPTHKIDCFKSKVGLEIEWNNKDPFFDRDLNNFRLLFDLMALDVGIIVTRNSDLQDIFNDLGKGKSYGNSTTHWDKLMPKIEGQGSGGCPVLVFGITKDLYNEYA